MTSKPKCYIWFILEVYILLHSLCPTSLIISNIFTPKLKLLPTLLANELDTESFVNLTDKCYFFSTDTKSWMEANAFCLGQNSNLMSIQDIHERYYWIGLNDQVTEGVWEWSDGSPFIPYLSYWMQGQPDNWGDEPGEDCGQVVGSSFAQWNDENCNVKRKYICKHINRKSAQWGP
uniref:C-type lectin domain-containing protein n=1 Tax=Seriola dumerili TaxID=41447 RepID=A0A3B4V093_SERDU